MPVCSELSGLSLDPVGRAWIRGEAMGCPGVWEHEDPRALASIGGPEVPDAVPLVQVQETGRVSGRTVR